MATSCGDGCTMAGPAPRRVCVPPNGIVLWCLPFTKTPCVPFGKAATAATPVASSLTTPAPAGRPWRRIHRRPWPGSARARPARTIVATAKRRGDPARIPRTANTTPQAMIRRRAPVVPMVPMARRPTVRLPATQPAMLAACRSPTLRPAVAGSSWTARCSSGKDAPMRNVGRPNRSEGQQPVEPQHPRPVAPFEEAEPHGSRPVAVVPAQQRQVRRKHGQEQDGHPGIGDQRTLQGEEDGQRACHAVGARGRGQAPESGAEQVDEEQRAEGERGRLHGHVEQAEPHHFERERAEPAQRVEDDPPAERGPRADRRRRDRAHRERPRPTSARAPRRRDRPRRQRRSRRRRPASPPRSRRSG